MDELVNGLGLWIAGSFMVLVILVQSILYFRLGKNEADRLDIPHDDIVGAIRAAVITSIGPTLSSVIVLLSLVVVIGTPMAWMRLNDIGAARTELTIVSMSQALLPPGASDVQGFVFASWGQAFNNVGFMVVALLTISRIGWAVDIMNKRFNPKMVRAVMGGAAIGLFAFLVSNNLIKRPSAYWVAAASAGIFIIIVNKVFGKYQRFQELSLGLAMVVGMIAASIFK